MSKKKWYNWKMSRINQKPTWQSESKLEDYTQAEELHIDESKKNIENQESKTHMIEPQDTQRAVVPDSGLDMNLVISSFQEKLAQLTTELVVKDATIKQLTNIINKMRGQ